MSEAAMIRLLLRRGILPQRILEPEAEVAEYVQSRVQNLTLEIASRFQITECEAEQKIRENLKASAKSVPTPVPDTARRKKSPRAQVGLLPLCESFLRTLLIDPIQDQSSLTDSAPEPLCLGCLRLPSAPDRRGPAFRALLAVPSNGSDVRPIRGPLKLRTVLPNLISSASDILPRRARNFCSRTASGDSNAMVICRYPPAEVGGTSLY